MAAGFNMKNSLTLSLLRDLVKEVLFLGQAFLEMEGRGMLNRFTTCWLRVSSLLKMTLFEAALLVMFSLRELILLTIWLVQSLICGQKMK